MWVYCDYAHTYTNTFYVSYPFWGKGFSERRNLESQKKFEDPKIQNFATFFVIRNSRKPDKKKYQINE